MESLFMRWENQNVSKSPQQSEISLLTEKLARLEKRVAELEKHVVPWGEENGTIDLSQERYFPSYAANATADAGSTIPKRGRRPSISPDELARRRDDLINFIEPRWPDLVERMSQPKSLRLLLQTLKDVSPGAESTWQYKHLTENISSVWEFLVSGRYTAEPRQIAYAMAGVPGMKWRSSLDRCTKHPSKLPIHISAHTDHIRRRKPTCMESLLAEGPTKENLKVLRSCCEDCRRLALKPETVSEALQQGKPLIFSSNREKRL